MSLGRSLILSTLILCGSAQATLDEQDRREIDGLLTFVENSDCQFIRNGSRHAPGDARQHLQKKLDYLEKKGLLDSAEDFIARAATESSLSGKSYQVSCQGQLQPSSDWLNAELARLRQAL